MYATLPSMSLSGIFTTAPMLALALNRKVTHKLMGISILFERKRDKPLQRQNGAELRESTNLPMAKDPNSSTYDKSSLPLHPSSYLWATQVISLIILAPASQLKLRDLLINTPSQHSPYLHCGKQRILRSWRKSIKKKRTGSRCICSCTHKSCQTPSLSSSHRHPKLRCLQH